MKLLLTGLAAEPSAEKVKAGMERFGPVSHVEIVASKEGDGWAIVEMPITDEQAFEITRRISDIWHDGRFVNVRILNH